MHWRERKEVTQNGQNNRIPVTYNRQPALMPLEEGTYLIGNDRGCDIYLDVSGRGRTRLFLDVRPECVYLTVMKGTVTIAGTQYHANPGSRMELQEYMRIRVGNADLILQKERWR